MKKNKVSADTNGSETTIAVENPNGKTERRVEMDDPKLFQTVMVRTPKVPTPSELRRIKVGDMDAETIAYNRCESSEMSDEADLADDITKGKPLGGRMLAVEMPTAESRESIPWLVGTVEEGDDPTWASYYSFKASVDGSSVLMRLAPKLGPNTYDSSKLSDEVADLLADHFGNRLLAKKKYARLLASPAYGGSE